MNKFSVLLLGVAVALGATANVLAQEQDKDVTLNVDAGSVMTSEGGEFVSASTGKQLVEGQRVMVTEGAKATLVYDNGCREELVEPGVYTVDDDCVAGIILADGAAVAGSGGSILGVSSIPFFIGVAAVVTLALDSDDNTRPLTAPPVSQ